MPIVSSGEIALIADIEAEFDQTGTTDISLFQARDDAGFSAGEVAMSDFYSASDSVAPSVLIGSSSSITSSSFTANANVASDGGASITERGFYIGTSTTATNNTKYTVSGTTGSYTYAISGLSSSTTYYVFAFATNSAGTTITSSTSTTTTQPSLATAISLSGSGSWSWDVCSSSGSFGVSCAISFNNVTGGTIQGYSYGGSGLSGGYFSGSQPNGGSQAYGYHYWSTGSKSFTHHTTVTYSGAVCGGFQANAYTTWSRSGYTNASTYLGGRRNSY